MKIEVMKSINNTFRGRDKFRQTTCTLNVKKNIEKLYKDVQDGEEIGKGFSSVVSKIVRRSNGKVYACKHIQPDTLRLKHPNLRTLILKEAELLASLNHSHIIKVLDVFQDESGFYIVEELCKGHDLCSLLKEMSARGKQLDEEEARSLVKQLVSAISYMHKVGICHRDIKLENMILAESGNLNSLKIIDFGLSTRFEAGVKMTEQVGSPYTAAPEIILGYYDEKVDMWSAGVITYMILSGKEVFSAQILQVLKKRILYDEIALKGKEWNGISSQGKDFVLQLLERDVTKRMNAQEALQHEWFTGS